ncbi:MAG: hypothetical protein WD874_00260 [Parcubacteria group bacterium]
MNIPDLLYKIKSLRSGSESEVIRFNEEGEVVRHSVFDKVFLALIIILVGTLSFGLGRLTGTGERGGVTLEIDEGLMGSLPLNAVAGYSRDTQTENKGEVSASSKGTRYYYSHCRNTISEKNKIIFATPLLAEAAGYTLAANCRPR